MTFRDTLRTDQAILDNHNGNNEDDPNIAFCSWQQLLQEIWRPIERHLKKLPLLRCMPDVHFASIDLPYHGSKRDDSVAAVIDEMASTVHHPASKFVTLNTEAVHREVQHLRTKFGSRPIVGVGHSMGAVALWNVEAKIPGTFGGLVFFEWLDGAIVPENNGSDAVVLACHPSIEAAIYCGERLWLSDSEMSRVACPVALYSSDNTWLFDPVFFAGVEKKWPRIYKNHSPMKNTTHNLIMEKPMACAEAIHADLQELDCFKSAFAKL